MKKASGKGMNMHSGMTNKSPKAPSDVPKGASVDKDATRDGTAPTPASLGGRVA